MSPPSTSPQPADHVSPWAPPADGPDAAAGTMVHARCHLLAGTTHAPHTFERREVTIACPGHQNPTDVYVTTVAIQQRGGRRASR